MSYQNAYQDAKRFALETLSKEEVVVKLFEQASKQVTTAIFLIEREENVKAFNCIAKSQKIISTLDLSLDMHYEISVELREMYGFIYAKLGEANAQRDIQLLKDIWALINELKDSFKEAARENVLLKQRGF